MNPIKEFFKKKKSFKNAGPGRKLGDHSEGSAPSTSSKSLPTKSSVAKPHVQSDASQHAAQAALARLELNQKSNVNWSLAAVRAQARKELELEQQAIQIAKNEPKQVFQESCPLLAVSGVYFACPMIGPHVLPYKEIVAKIKEFLYGQLEHEPGLTSCLILYTFNKNNEKVKAGVETLSRYITNIMDNPTEEKYRKIRMNNKVFQERVAPLEGAINFLMAAGFNRQVISHQDTEEEYFVLQEDVLNDLDMLHALKDALYNAEPIRPVLDRNIKLLMPSQSADRINLPQEFFNLTVEELKREQEFKTQAVEINSQLRTKAMREREEIRESRVYKYSLVRIKFPDGIILQGTFNVHEKLAAIKEFIVDNLAQPEREYHLVAPGGVKLSQDDSSLMEIRLIPAVLLNLIWSDDDSTSNDEVAYLKPETMCLLQNF